VRAEGIFHLDTLKGNFERGIKVISCFKLFTVESAFGFESFGGAMKAWFEIEV